MSNNNNNINLNKILDARMFYLLLYGCLSVLKEFIVWLISTFQQLCRPLKYCSSKIYTLDLNNLHIHVGESHSVVLARWMFSMKREDIMSTSENVVDPGYGRSCFPGVKLMKTNWQDSSRRGKPGLQFKTCSSNAFFWT